MERNREFFHRRLHSLLGVIPVGIFLVQHLVINHFATQGASAYNKAASFMANLPFVLFLEIFLIFLPIVYHAIYGLYIAFQAKNNPVQYSFFRNWMFTLQRITGVILLIFIAWHVWETRIQAAFGAEVNYDMMADILSSPFMLIFYIVGVVAATFHLSNGLWSFAVSWGITVTPRSQQITTYVTVVIFFVLTFIGIRALLAFINPDLANI
mgnify:CR=1 FL=1